MTVLDEKTVDQLIEKRPFLDWDQVMKVEGIEQIENVQSKISAP